MWNNIMNDVRSFFRRFSKGICKFYVKDSLKSFFKNYVGIFENILIFLKNISRSQRILLNLVDRKLGSRSLINHFSFIHPSSISNCWLEFYFQFFKWIFISNFWVDFYFQFVSGLLFPIFMGTFISNKWSIEHSFTFSN